jgi:hypothetical protein
MTDEEIIKFCIKHGITADQFFFMWLIARKDFTNPLKYSYAKQYIKSCGKFNDDLVQVLVEKNMIEDFNTPGNSLPEMYMVKENILSEFFIDESAGEELYNRYPATFPLAGGGSFVARAGGDKEDLIAIYLKRIKNNPEKHKFVMGQLRRYIELVKCGKINGHKISDWIQQELWDTVANIEEKGAVTFGRDI